MPKKLTLTCLLALVPALAQSIWSAEPAVEVTPDGDVEFHNDVEVNGDVAKVPYLVVKPQDENNGEGGEIELMPSVGEHSILLDSRQGDFRVHSNGVEWLRMSENWTTANGMSLSYLRVYPQNEATEDGGEIELKGANGRPSIFLDSLYDMFRVHGNGGAWLEISETQTKIKNDAIVNGGLEADGIVSAVNGNVILNDDANGSIELGNANNANKEPFIDFHTNGGVDFNARIQASGGNSTDGDATLHLNASKIQVVSDLEVGNNIIMGNTLNTISANSATGSNGKMTLASGSSASNSSGANIALFGNTNTAAEGLIQIIAGDALDGDIDFYTGPTSKRMSVHRDGKVIIYNDLEVMGDLIANGVSGGSGGGASGGNGNVWSEENAGGIGASLNVKNLSSVTGSATALRMFAENTAGAEKEFARISQENIQGNAGTEDGSVSIKVAANGPLKQIVNFSNIGTTFTGDVIQGGTNSWKFHTPDDHRTSMHIAPMTGGVWDWSNATIFYNDGNVEYNGDIYAEKIHAENDLALNGSAYIGQNTEALRIWKTQDAYLDTEDDSSLYLQPLSDGQVIVGGNPSWGGKESDLVVLKDIYGEGDLDIKGEAVVHENLEVKGTITKENVAVLARITNSQPTVYSGTRLNFSNIISDTHNAVTTGSNWEFTAPEEGWYRISIATHMLSGGAHFVNMYKNGSLFVRISQGGNMATGSVDMPLSVNDKIHFVVLGSTSTIHSNMELTWISIIKN